MTSTDFFVFFFCTGVASRNFRRVENADGLLIVFVVVINTLAAYSVTLIQQPVSSVSLRGAQ